MAFYRNLLLRSLLAASETVTTTSTTNTVKSLNLTIHISTRSFAFSSAEEAAAERRRRKRRLRIEPPLQALRDQNTPRPPRDPNAPRLPDSTSSLVGPRLNLHNRVQSSIRAGDLDEASITARQAVFSSTRPTVFTCNAIIAAMYRAKRYDDAVALFRYFFDQSNIVPNVVSYNFLIVTHCEAGRVDLALEVYRRILDTAPFSPSHVTYRHLTKGLVDADRMTEALDTLREMLNRGHGADSLVYNNLISGFIDRDNMDKAMELFDELRERCVVYDGVIHATFMDAYFKLGDEKEAMASYQSLLDRQFKMSAVTCNVLLECLLKHERISEANKLFEHMLTAHTPPNFVGMTTETYNIMVNDCFKKGDFATAIEVFHRTGTKPCVMDAGCFNNIIGKLVVNDLVSDALKLFEEMSGRSVNPDAATYGIFIDYYFGQGNTDEALQWFDDMVNKTEGGPKIRIDSYNKMYDGLVKAGRVGIAADIFKKMWERGLKPNSDSYEIMISGLCRENLLHQVKSFVEEMVRIRVSVTPELRELVAVTFDNKGRGEEVDGMFAFRPQTQTETQNSPAGRPQYGAPPLPRNYSYDADRQAPNRASFQNQTPPPQSQYRPAPYGGDRPSQLSYSQPPQYNSISPSQVPPPPPYISTPYSSSGASQTSYTQPPPPPYGSGGASQTSFSQSPSPPQQYTSNSQLPYGTANQGAYYNTTPQQAPPPYGYNHGPPQATTYTSASQAGGYNENSTQRASGDRAADRAIQEADIVENSAAASTVNG